MNYSVDFIQRIRKRMLTLGHFDLAFLLFSAQGLFALMCALIIFELLGLFGILLDTITLLVAIVFDRLFGRILGKVLRKNLALVFYLIFQISIFGLIGIVGIGLARTPIQTMYGSLGFGLWASIVCLLESYHILMSFQEAYRLGLDLEKLEKAFVQLPDMFRKNQHVLEGYSAAVYVVPLLYSSHEYLFTTITIGNIIQNLLDVVDRSPNTGPTTKAKRLDLNVSFEEITINNQSRIFDFEYFWHNVRSKFAHVTILSRYGIEEPSPETARKSLGLLCMFLKEYPARVARLGDETTT